MTVQDSFPPVQDRPWLKVYRELGVTAEPPRRSPSAASPTTSRTTRKRAAQVALVYTDKGIEITWAQLDAYANRFANLLRSLGMQKGDVMGIHLPNTPQYVVALVGAAKAGVTVSGVSPLLTPPEIIHQVNDAHDQAAAHARQALQQRRRPGRQGHADAEARAGVRPDRLPRRLEEMARLHAEERCRRSISSRCSDTQVHDYWPRSTPRRPRACTRSCTSTTPSTSSTPAAPPASPRAPS